jgi:hypothetical protein
MLLSEFFAWLVNGVALGWDNNVISQVLTPKTVHMENSKKVL